MRCPTVSIGVQLGHYIVDCFAFLKDHGIMDDIVAQLVIHEDAVDGKVDVDILTGVGGNSHDRRGVAVLAGGVLGHDIIRAGFVEADGEVAVFIGVKACVGEAVKARAGVNVGRKADFAVRVIGIHIHRLGLHGDVLARDGFRFTGPIMLVVSHVSS